MAGKQTTQPTAQPAAYATTTIVATTVPVTTFAKL
jgi:hypothetical protein